jgi:hypothetical protein
MKTLSTFLQLAVLAWQIEMAVHAGIAASHRPKGPPPSPSKQVVEAPCTTGTCQIKPPQPQETPPARPR